MIKIPTMFTRDPADMSRVTREVTTGCQWVLDGEGMATIKRDGTNVRATVKCFRLVAAEKRRNPSRKEKAKGAEPRYVPVTDDPADKHIRAAFDATIFATWPDGEWPCEALGPKIQGGTEGGEPRLYPFSLWPEILHPFRTPRTFDEIEATLGDLIIEGIVWHHPDGRMAKIKRRDFGIKWTGCAK